MVNELTNASLADSSLIAVSRLISAVFRSGVFAESVTTLPRIFCAAPLPSIIIPLCAFTVTLPVLPASNIPMVILLAASTLILPPLVVVRLPVTIAPL